jgi:hypothetical protein
MKVEQILHDEIQESQKALHGPIDDTIYRRDHLKRIELINWVLENMNNQSTPICEIIETRMNEIIDNSNETHYTLEADPLDSELRILEWIFYQVCSSKIKKL